MARFRVGRVDVWTVAMALLASIAASELVSAQEPSPETAIDSIMRAEGLDHGVPALGVSVVADGQVVFQRAYGYADLSTRRAATVATPFNIASLTKPFISAVAMQLVAEERIDRQDRVASHLPSLPPRPGELHLRRLRLRGNVDVDLRCLRRREDAPGTALSAGGARGRGLESRAPRIRRSRRAGDVWRGGQGRGTEACNRAFSERRGD